MTSSEAELVVEKRAEVFENSKDYLLQRWSEKGERGNKLNTLSPLKQDL